MKTQSMIPQLAARLAALSLFITPLVFADGIPEPGLVMYGAVRNTTAANARVTTGTLTWTITPASGSPVTVTTPLIDISGQYSYALRVPFESVVGSTALSSNTLPLNSATTSYVRANVFLTVNGTNFPATISAPALGTFNFNTADRGRLDPVDLTVNAPGLGVPVAAPSFAAVPRFTDGKFQLTVNGNIGQSYTLLASTDLVNWTPVTVFVCTNSSTLVFDPTSINYPRRFYKIAQAQ